MAQATIRIEGLYELQRAFNRLDRKLTRQLGDELKRAAQPVADTSRERISHFRGASLSTIRVTRSGLRVFVQQGARKVTGKRGDFGALQFREMSGALNEESDEVVQAIDHVFGRWAGEEGF